MLPGKGKTAGSGAKRGRCPRLYACVALLLAWLGLGVPPALAHEFTLEAVVNVFVKVQANEAHLVVRAPLYLFKAARFPVKGPEIDVDASGPALERALAALQHGLVISEDGRPLKAARGSARLALPSDRSFDGYEAAAAHVAMPIEAGTHIVADQGYVDAHLIYPVDSPQAVLSLQTSIAPELGDYLKIALRYIGPEGGGGKAMVIRGNSGSVDLNPTRWDAASGFVGLGFLHIIGGFDHLLFLACLAIPLRGMRQLLTVVTGFTLAHSFTLLGSALGLAPRGAWFPPFVETMIALSIVYTAVENIVGVAIPRRVMLAVLFGLVHGFAFSESLAEELQFAGSHLVVSLFAFNLGIELGQVAALAVMLPIIALVTQKLMPDRVGGIVLSALLAHVGWHWLEDRWEALVKAPWPVINPAGLWWLALWIAGMLLVSSLVLMAVGRLRLGSAAPGLALTPHAARSSSSTPKNP